MVFGRREVSKHLPGAGGFIFPKYQPIPTHGDPIQPPDNQIFTHLTRRQLCCMFFYFKTFFSLKARCEVPRLPPAVFSKNDPLVNSWFGNSFSGKYKILVNNSKK